MRFSLALAMSPPEQILPLARAAEANGWDAVTMPDSVFYPESVSAGYPFTPDGARFWPAETPFVDPLVGLAAVGAVTERIWLYTNVLKTPLRHPLLVAKSVSSLAAMFPRRVALGVGLSWIPEEFAWLDQDMSTCGRRLDEDIDVIRMICAGGWAEHHGAHYDFGRLRIEPTPPPDSRVPIYVGGHSDAAIRRACRRGDGWIGAQCDQDAIDDIVARLRHALAATGRTGDDFEIKLTPLVAATPDAMRRVFESGVTDVITVPWYFFDGNPDDPDHQIDSVARFADTVIRPLRDLESPL